MVVAALHLRGPAKEPERGLAATQPLHGGAEHHAPEGVTQIQVERVAASNSLNPREVQIPGILVDCVVVADPENHVQTYGTSYSHAFSGRQRVPMDRVVPLELDERKIIARRCAFELPPGGRGQSRDRDA